jgi:hypothetical protein
MDTIFEDILELAMHGGPMGLMAVLVGIILFLWFERKRLLIEIERKDDKIDSIIDDYSKGNVTLSEALNSLKLVLYEMKGKIN